MPSSSTALLIDVLAFLAHGEQVGRAHIRRVGQIAASLGIVRHEAEPYDRYINRILENLEGEVHEDIGC